MVSAYADLVPNVSDSKGGLLCPFCHGGQSEEKSFSVRRYLSGVYWKCWRVSCGKSGKLFTSSDQFVVGADEFATDIAPKKTFDFNLDFGAIREIWTSELTVKYGLLPQDYIGRGWMENTVGELVIPLRTADGVVVGHEFRRIPPKTPKSRMSITSPVTQFPRNYFSSKKIKDVVVVVEDSISALKVAKVCRAYSLQGSSLTRSQVDDIHTLTANPEPVEQVIIALDRDASERASNYIKTFRFVLPNLTFMPLQQDLKYVPVARIEEMVNGYRKKG